jgi:hypothetical protein
MLTNFINVVTCLLDNLFNNFDQFDRVGLGFMHFATTTHINFSPHKLCNFSYLGNDFNHG